MQKRDASLDTSFWAVAVTAGVFTYLFDFFDIHYSAAVAAEIDTNPASGYVFPQAQAFRLCRDRMELSEPDQPWPGMYQTGERYALALARERGWVCLINDAKPYWFGRRNGVTCISVPEFCVMIRAAGLLSSDAVRGYLQRIRRVTSPTLWQLAMTALDLMDRGGAP